MRKIRLHAFASVKGGVGKSTLAFTTACLQARFGKTVFLDCDLSGTSVADGLELEAAKSESPGEFYTSSETIEQRALRRSWDRNGSPKIAYLNDILSFGRADEKECSVASLLWRSKEHSDLGILPSSSLARDVEQALTWLHDESLPLWTQRLAWILFALLEQIPDLEDIVCDLPPGLFGFSREVLAVLAALSQGRDLPSGYPNLGDAAAWSVHPILVTSQDSNDLVLALESYASLLMPLPRLRVVVNRASHGLQAIRENVKKRMIIPGMESLGLETVLKKLDDHTSLRRLFWDGRLQIDPQIDRDFSLALGLPSKAATGETK